MALNVAQLMNVPGGPGVIGAVTAGTGISISDGVISATQGGVTKLVAGTGIELNPSSGLGDVTISLQGGPGNFLPLTGGTLTGPLALAPGTISAAGLTFSNGVPGTGLYSPKPNFVGLTTTNQNTGFWMNDFGQIMAGRPEAVPDSYNLGATTYQAWSDSQTEPGQQNPGMAMFYMGDNNTFLGRVRFCRGEGNISNIQDIEAGDEIGDILWCEAYASNPTGIPRAAITCNQVADAPNEGTRMYLWNTLQSTPSAAMARRWWLGGEGNWVPNDTDSYEIGNFFSKVLNIWLKNSPIVGQPQSLQSISTLQAELGLGYINALQPVSYTPSVEYNEVSATWAVEPSETNWNGVPGPSIVNPIPGTTTHWGFMADDVVALNQSLGLQGELGVAGVASEGIGSQEFPWIRNEELLPPVVLAIQQLSAQLDDLQAAFDAYVATHP